MVTAQPPKTPLSIRPIVRNGRRRKWDGVFVNVVVSRPTLESDAPWADYCVVLHRRERHMSFWDFFANAATGGAYGALETGIDVITQKKVSSDSATPKPLGSGHGGLFGGFAGGMLGQPAGPRATTCCDRYTFSDGFLVDGVTGLVWRFDERQKALVEVPRKPAEEKQPLIKALLEAQLQNIRDQQNAQLVGPLSPDLRQEAAKQFEKRFVKPLWDSAGVG